EDRHGAGQYRQKCTARVAWGSTVDPLQPSWHATCRGRTVRFFHPHGQRRHDIPPRQSKVICCSQSGPMPPAEAALAAVPRLSWTHELGQRWGSLVCLVLSVPLLIATIGDTLSWPGRVFPGFFVMETGLVPTVAVTTWTGMRAGVPFHSRVVAVNGHAVDSSRAIYAAVEAEPPGTSFVYTLEKDGERFERTVPSMRFKARDYWLTVGLFLANGVLDLIAGFTVIFLQPRAADSRGFLAFCISSAVFALTGTALYLPEHPWLGQLHYLSQAMFPAAYIHFALVFPVVRPFLRRDRRWLAVPYGVSTLLTLAIWWDQARPVPTLLPLHAAYLFSA